MKRYLLGLLFVCGVAFASDFCDGYQEGYKEGYCYGKNACIEPLAPLCPLPNVGDSTYQDGYNRGFVDGRRAANTYSVQWDSIDNRGNRVSSGLYFYRITAPRYTQTRKLAMLK